MKSRKIINYILCTAVSTIALTGCKNSETEPISMPESVTQETEATNQDNLQQEEMETENNIVQDDTENPVAQEEREDNVTQEENETQSIFKEVSNVEFCFSSGAGGWGTVLKIHEDGTFEGEYHDSDMGDVGEGYPNGVVYLCNFRGKFTQPEKISDIAYLMKVEYIENENQPGTEEFRDGVCYRYSDPYGMESAEDFYIYLPGAPLEQLPEGFLSWVGYYDLNNTADTRLPYYGLYNVNPEYGFSGYLSAEAKENIDAELALIEAEAAIIEGELQSGILNQMQLNQTSAELYRLWDDELNSIWSRLKEKLAADEMEALTQEERAWIAEKEREVEAVGEAYGAGTMRPAEENLKAAEMTRDRVYKLAERLR